MLTTFTDVKLECVQILQISDKTLRCVKKSRVKKEILLMSDFPIPMNQSIKAYADHLASFFASSLTYPFTVVGNCMAVSHSGLAASYPPHMPLYQVNRLTL